MDLQLGSVCLSVGLAGQRARLRIRIIPRVNRVRHDNAIEVRNLSNDKVSQSFDTELHADLEGRKVHHWRLDRRPRAQRRGHWAQQSNRQSRIERGQS